jgi:type VI protein secretion system component Hcp
MGTDQLEIYTIELTQCLVSSCQTSGAGGGDSRPTCSYSFAAVKAQITYKQQQNDGSLGGPVIGGFDTKTNKTS